MARNSQNWANTGNPLVNRLKKLVKPADDLKWANRARRLIDDCYQRDTGVLNISAELSSSEPHIASVIASIAVKLPPWAKQVIVDNLDIKWKTGKSMIISFQQMIAKIPDLEIIFGDNCVYDEETKRLIRRTLNPDNVDGDIFEVAAPKMDMKFLVQGIIQRWLVTKNRLFLENLANNGDISDSMYALLRNQEESDNAIFNTNLRAVIKSLNANEVDIIKSIAQKIKALVGSIPDLDSQVKKKRVSPNDLAVFDQYTQNREAYNLALEEAAALRAEQEAIVEKLNMAQERDKYLSTTTFSWLLTPMLEEKIANYQQLVETIHAAIDTKNNTEIAQINKEIAVLESDGAILAVVSIDEVVDAAIEQEMSTIDNKLADNSIALEAANDEVQQLWKAITELEQERNALSGEERKAKTAEIGLSKWKHNKAKQDVNLLETQKQKLETEKGLLVASRDARITKETTTHNQKVLNNTKLLDKANLALNNANAEIQQLQEEAAKFQKYCGILQDIIDQSLWLAPEEQVWANVEAIMKSSLATLLAQEQKELGDIVQPLYDSLSEELLNLASVQSANSSRIEALNAANEKTLEWIETIHEQIEALKKVQEEYQRIQDVIGESLAQPNPNSEEFRTEIKKLKLGTEPAKFIESILARSLWNLIPYKDFDKECDTKIASIWGQIKGEEQKIEAQKSQIGANNDSILTLQQEDASRPSLLTQELLAQKTRIDNSINLKQQHIHDLDGNYNQSYHATLESQFNDGANDSKHQAAIIAQTIKDKIESGDKEWTELIEELGLLLDHIDTETLVKYGGDSRGVFDLRAAMDDVQHPEFTSRFAAFLYKATKVISTFLVGASSWVWVWQVALVAGPYAGYQLTDIAAWISMMVWWVIWWGLFRKTEGWYQKMMKQGAVKSLMNGNDKVFARLIRRRTLAMLLATTILCIADSSSVGTVWKWWKKTAKTVATIKGAQDKYQLADANLNVFLDQTQDKMSSTIAEILGQEERWELWGGVWKWPRWVAENAILYGEAYVRDLAAGFGIAPKTLEDGIALAKQKSPKGLGLVTAANKKLDSAQWKTFNSLNFRGNTVLWKDIAPKAATFGKWRHGAEAALPSTGIKIQEYAHIFWVLVANENSSKGTAVAEFNANIEEAKKSLNDVGSAIVLNLLDKEAVNQNLAKKKELGDQIVKELSHIEAYTDIFSMWNFVKKEEWNKWAWIFFWLVLLTLLILHGSMPLLGWLRIKKALREQLAHLKAMWPKQTERVDRFYQDTMPALLTTPAWRAMIRELKLTDEALSTYILDYMQHGAFGNTAQHQSIMKIINTNFVSFVKKSDMFLDSITEPTRDEISSEVGDIFGEPLVDYYNKYINNAYLSRDILVAFVSKLFQKSALFREKFYMYNRDNSLGNA
jgi:hypothetical protein